MSVIIIIIIIQICLLACIGCTELASDETVQERMPSDLNELQKSDLFKPAAEIGVSQMSFTEAEADASWLNTILNVQQPEDESL